MKYFVSKTAIAKRANQMVKNQETLPRTAKLTASCINPQKIKVNINAAATGKYLFKGLKINLPR
ncbi:hypothetical protein [Haloflavibacter putidus]|uniref:hypothetical protein n=1 Tax=Haloflavibacter putidus TaxID=2576776 RepID=UPI001F20E30B|nr:hypothetical protein [Haloflavibacter putidus]